MAFTQYNKARQLAVATPPTRNRYADFLRAAAILAVVVGHWLMAAVWVDDAGVHTANALGIVDATQWLTWALQVMPIFFFVGGFSNAVGWRSCGPSYPAWLSQRLRRLVVPTLPLILLWAGIALAGPQWGLDPGLLRSASRVALVPLWFLAVYVLMVAATPITMSLWTRFGPAGVAALTACAFAVDALRRMNSIPIGFVNYFFVWTAIYLLGHAWQDGFFADRARSLVLGGAGAALLLGLTLAGPYHVSMVGVPGVEFGNTAPPSAALLALGFAQIGLALTLERPVRRFLERPAAWAATIMVNASIMTIYVWHMTAMALGIGALLLIRSPLLAISPGGAGWWLSRPIWLAVLAVATVPFIVIWGRRETRTRQGSTVALSTPATLLVTLAVCVMFTSVAAQGLTLERPAWALAAMLPLVPIHVVMIRRRRP
jgi:hypothetical protein